MIEIIKKEEGEQSIKEQFATGKAQISYNSDGHLVIRVIHDKERDTLIVCDFATSNKIIEFCQFYLSDKDQKLRDIPF